MLRIRLLAGMKDKEPSQELQIHNDITLEQIKQQLDTKRKNYTEPNVRDG